MFSSYLVLDCYQSQLVHSSDTHLIKGESNSSFWNRKAITDFDLLVLELMLLSLVMDLDHMTFEEMFGISLMVRFFKFLLDSNVDFFAFRKR